MSNPQVNGVLVRIPAGSTPAIRKALSVAGPALEFEPLFKVDQTAAADGLGLTEGGGGWQWHIARLKESQDGANGWDLAHAAIAPGLGIAGDAALIEPDLIQDWIPSTDLPGGKPVLAVNESCTFQDQLAKLPGVRGKFAWHLDDAFTQLRAARDEAGATGASNTIRICHLDTGYDPDHSSLPVHLREELQRNFVGDGDPDDARDRLVTGTLKNPGHGTGTLSILAGRRVNLSAQGYAAFDDVLGGAPAAGIIPLRVGNSVVQFATSSVAQAIDYAVSLTKSPSTMVHVLSMSMGGVASQAWADAVNMAYEAGIVYVAAAGNNFSAGVFGLPTRLIVYPARFRRVVAACGVMANGHPYFGLPLGTMQGNWGPSSKMATAMAAFTPNIPWAAIGCKPLVDMDGSGTSSATPQIAAAAALYFQQHAATLFDKARYPEPWMRAEAVRQALFSGANRAAEGGKTEKLGNGILQAAASLRIRPIEKERLQKIKPDSAGLSLLNVFTGFGLSATNPAALRMLALESAQLAQQWHRGDVPNPFDETSADPDLPADAIAPSEQRRLLSALREHPRASKALKQHLEQVLGKQNPSASKAGRKPKAAGPGSLRPTEKELADQATINAAAPRQPFTPPKPPHRRLRAFAIDPSLATTLETAPISRVALTVPWEPLGPGPEGEYLEVLDLDPASNCVYEPVDLDLPTLLAQDGLEPSEGTPQFHQQMVYAVASLTIHNFELALGRRTLWRPGPSPDPKQAKNDSRFVQRLRIYPHALRERNAYYSPDKIALLFGYFRGVTDDSGDHMGGGMVFTALSHDIIAHETTHALLDGMNRAFLAPTNPDVHAFHEAFADIVAILQHFTFPEILRHQISNTRGEIRSRENLLGQLAGQFGRGTGSRTALRDAIGKFVDGVWVPHVPNPNDYESTTEPHDRGSILVAAVFDAFLAIYETRTADLLRLATQGSGVLRPGAIHPDLVNRLADEAARAAQHVLTMCIRALDYCPIIDITFGEYLRAIITADFDLVPDDDLNYRVAFIEAFRKRGIYPRDVRTLSVESLLWNSPVLAAECPSPHLEGGLGQVRAYVQEYAYSESREQIFYLERRMRLGIHRWLREHLSDQAGEGDAAFLGLDPAEKFEVRTARLAFRTSPDGGMLPQLILSILQETGDADQRGLPFEGGCTVIADLRRQKIKYCIRKSARSASRMARQQAFSESTDEGLRATYFSSTHCGNEPFAMLHRGI